MDFDSRDLAATTAMTSRARLERISEPWALNRTFAIAGTLVLAMVLGAWAASGEFENLILVCVWFAAVMTIVFVQDHWWSPALIITALSFQTTALGFPLTGLEIGMVILALTFPVKLAMKTLRKAQPEMDLGILYWLLLAFVCTHAVIIFGYSRIEGVQLKNIVKAYYSCITPLIFYGLLYRYCATRTVKPAVVCLFAASLFAVTFSVFTILFGLDLEPFSGLRISLDWLNHEGAQGVLRSTAPILLFGCLAFWPSVRPGQGRSLLAAGIFICVLGTLLSGGRLSLAICVIGALFFAFVRRKLWIAVPVIVLTGLTSAIITMHPDIMYSLPVSMQRAITPLNFSEKQTDIQGATEASDNWHHDLRVGSLDYWTADTKSFFLGHGFKAWDESLATGEAPEAGDYERMVQAAIEMGRTENMFSAVTNIFGLTGFVLYMLFLGSLAWRLWKAINICPPRSTARSLCEFSFINLASAMLFAPLVGGTPGLILIYWLIGLLAARPYIAAGKSAPASSVAPAEPPAFARPAFATVVSQGTRPGRLRPRRV